MKIAASITIAVATVLAVVSCTVPGGPNGQNGNCPTNSADCGGGSCQDLLNDNQNCGACGNACGTGSSCVNGSCSCETGATDCGSGCTPLASDPQNCGSCGNACGQGLFCSSGSCVDSCPAGQEACGASCVDLTSDSFNCGACGNSCAAGQACVGGACSCGGGQVTCGGACVNVQTNALHCGSCGNACGAGQSCNAGVCTGGNPGSGGSPGVGGGGGTGNTSSGGNANTGGVSNTGGTAGTGGTSNTGGSSNVGDTPPGYWTYEDWGGCVWTGIDEEPDTTTNITPQDFTSQEGGPYCVSGSVHDTYESVALLGFNLAEPAATADCTYTPVDPDAQGPPSVDLTGSGLAISFNKKVATTLRVQIQGPDGASDPSDRWCYTITDAAGPVFAPYDEFNTECWEGGDGDDYNGEPISAVVFLTPGVDGSNTDFDYCIDGFAAGDSVDDAPDGSDGGPLTGTIGGAGSDDLDFQRVKVTADGKSYIIQNNNWGNPSGTNQTLSYEDNSFTITQTTGNGPGNGVPASFPSIYIGANGDTQGGVFSTSSDDNLPMQVSSISSIPTTFSWSGGNSGGNFNATYDVWFADHEPTEPYDDALHGFVMVWLYKPSGNQPIGSVQRTANIAGQTWNVWVGPRGGDGSNSGAPVVSYVAQASPLMSMDFDLMDFISDAQQDGIQSSWYLTDVFGGFEIWSGGDTNGLLVDEFTAVVQ